MKQGVLERVMQIYESISNGDERFDSKFAELIGSNKKTISQQLKGERAISLDTILNILSAFPDISSEWLLRGNGDMNISDNLPKFHGEETDTELNVHAELARKTAELEELKLQVLRLDAQKDYLQERNDDLVVSCRMLQDELNRYQEPKKKKDIV